MAVRPRVLSLLVWECPPFYKELTDKEKHLWNAKLWVMPWLMPGWEEGKILGRVYHVGDGPGPDEVTFTIEFSDWFMAEMPELFEKHMPKQEAP